MSPDHQFEFARMNHKIMNRCCGQIIAEGLPVITLIQRDVNTKVGSDIEDVFVARIFVYNIDRFGGQISRNRLPRPEQL